MARTASAVRVGMVRGVRKRVRRTRRTRTRRMRMRRMRMRRLRLRREAHLVVGGPLSL